VIVVDASAVLELLLRTSKSGLVEERLLTPGETLHAPALLDLEVAQVLRRYVMRDQITARRAAGALDLLAAMPLQRYTHEPLLARVWGLRANLTAYDAAYVALAEGLGAPLVTCDARMAGAPGIRATVEVMGE